MARPAEDFQTQGHKPRPSLVWELIAFAAARKKWWLVPLLICLALLALLMGVAGSGAAPFIYTLF